VLQVLLPLQEHRTQRRDGTRLRDRGARPQHRRFRYASCRCVCVCV
jgi:hypothetical protein